MNFVFDEIYFYMGWGLVNEQENQVKNIPIEEIVANKNALEYWGRRFLDCSHPLLKLRYADLIWEFSKGDINKSIKADVAREIIKCTKEIIDENLIHESSSVTEKVSKIGLLRRALYISKCLKDHSLEEAVIKIGIKLHDQIKMEDGLLSKTFAFDLFLNQKTNISPNDEKILVNDLEKYFNDCCLSNDFDFFDILNTSEILSAYFKRTNNSAKKDEILRNAVFALEKISSKFEPLIAVEYLKKIHRIFGELGDANEADRVLIKIRDLSPAVLDSLKPVGTEFQITQKEIDQLLKAVIVDDLEKTINNLIIYFLPRKKKIFELLKDLAQDHPLLFLMPKKIVDKEGLTVAYIGSLNDDLDGNIIYEISRNLQMNRIYLKFIFDELNKKHFKIIDDYMRLITTSPLFPKDSHVFIKEALKDYLEKKYIQSSHVLIPQIEAALRRLAKKIGIVTIKFNRNGGYDYKILHELLRDSQLVEFLGEDVCNFLNVLLTEKRGLNWRNDMFHGLMEENEINEVMMNYLLMVVFLLCTIKFQ